MCIAGSESMGFTHATARGPCARHPLALNPPRLANGFGLQQHQPAFALLQEGRAPFAIAQNHRRCIHSTRNSDPSAPLVVNSRLHNNLFALDDLAKRFAGRGPVHHIHPPGQVGFGEGIA